MTHAPTFKIKADGTMHVVAHAPDDLASFRGRVAHSARGGYVWPQRRLKRFAFRLLRKLFGRNGRIAAWTRTWRGPWTVIVAATGQPLPGTFATHGDAVDAEVVWMLAKL